MCGKELVTAVTPKRVMLDISQDNDLQLTQLSKHDQMPMFSSCWEPSMNYLTLMAL